MKLISILKYGVWIIGMVVSAATFAIPMPPVPLEPLYFEPPIVEATSEVRQLSCVQLDNSIRYLHPYRYTYKEGFYDDDFNVMATTAITFDSVPILKGLLGFIYLGYSAAVEEKEQRRVMGIEQQISMLQQVKAEKHCFE